MYSSNLRAWILFLVVASGLFTSETNAQLGGYNRITTPNGRAVLEIRKGTHPASPNLLFTAVITTGPSGGTTSLRLKQAIVQDVLNPALPAAAWSVVRSSFTGFSLGGGCGRSNLIDFPFINANRPEILRITGTTAQVIVLGIANSDQYDSIDCLVQNDGQILYMLTNRTQKKLEFRREVVGALSLIRDDFGEILTPFVGGIRPSMARMIIPPTVSLRTDPSGGASQGFGFEVFFAKYLLPDQILAQAFGLRDDPPLTNWGTCSGPTSPVPPGFSIPKESTVADGVAVANSRSDNVLWGDYFSVGDGNCSVVQPSESFGSAGPFSLYTWAGVAAEQFRREFPEQGGVRVAHTTLVVPGNVIVFEGNQRQSLPSPFSSRGGPVAVCPLSGSEIDSALLAIGVGSSIPQVQHSIVDINLLETIFGSSFESVWGSLARCD